MSASPSWTTAPDRRKLTPRERDALASAVALYDTELEDRGEEGEPVGIERAALQRAWRKVQR